MVAAIHNLFIFLAISLLNLVTSQNFGSLVRGSGNLLGLDLSRIERSSEIFSTSSPGALPSAHDVNVKAGAASSSNPLQLPEGFTCRHSCGMTFTGCSCDVTCAVYGNCCEDFHSECPDVVTSSREKFGQLLTTVGITCRDDMWEISRCLATTRTPGSHTEHVTTWMKSLSSASRDPIDRKCWADALELDNSITDNDISKFETAEKFPTLDLSASSPSLFDDGHDEVMDEVLGTSQEDLMRTRVMSEMANRRVSDRSTGLVYSNISVFMCHVAAMRQTAETRGQMPVPCVWELHIAISDNPSPLEALQEAQRTRFFQKPPHGISQDTIAQCSSIAIRHCDETAPNFSSDLKAKCQNFTSTVLSSVKSTHGNTQTYQNRYCLECNEGTGSIDENNMVAGTRYVLPDFTALVSMSNSDISLRLSPQTEYYAVAQWSAAVCDVSKGFLCEIRGCAESFYRRADGTCKQKLVLHMALRVYGDLTPGDHVMLGETLSCMVDRHLALDLAGQVHLTRFEFEDKYSIFGLKMVFYGIQGERAKDFFENLKVFSRYLGNAMSRILGAHDVSDVIKPTDEHYCEMTYTEPKHRAKYQYEAYKNVQNCPSTRGNNPLFCFAVSDPRISFFTKQVTLTCPYPRPEGNKAWQEAVRNIRKDVCFKSFFPKDQATSQNMGSLEKASGDLLDLDLSKMESSSERSNNSGISSGDMIVKMNGDYLADGDENNDDKYDEYDEYYDVMNGDDVDRRESSGCVVHRHSFICIALAGVIRRLELSYGNFQI